MKKVLLEAYLKHNLGDDLFLYIFSKRYPDLQFYVKAAGKYVDGFKLKNVHSRTVFRRVLDRIWLKFSQKPLYRYKYDAEVIIGGSMFIENNLSEEGLKKYLKTKYLNTVPLFFMGENFGPYRSDYYYEEHKMLFSHAKDVCFREKYSADLFRDLTNIRVAPDIVFCLNTDAYNVKHEKKVIISVINLEKRKDISAYREEYEEKIAEISDYYSAKGYEVVLMSFCASEGDEDAVRAIVSKTNKSIRTYLYNGNINEALNEIASSELIIGTRFHSIVLGLVFDKKVLPIIYSDKTLNMLSDVNYNGEMIGIENICNLEVSKIDEKSNKLNSLSSIRNESKKHFSVFEKFLEESK